MSPPRSNVWKSFNKIDSATAACKICFKHFKTSGNTSNLAKHLKQHQHHTNTETNTIDLTETGGAGEIKKKKFEAIASTSTSKPEALTGASSTSKKISLHAWASPSIATASTSSFCSKHSDHPCENSEMTEMSELEDGDTDTAYTSDSNDATATRVKRKHIDSAGPLETTSRLFTPSIKDALKRMKSFKEGGSRHAAITQCILYFICKDNRPFNCVTGQGFRKLMHELCSSYKIPHPDTFKEKLAIKYDLMKSIYKERLSSVPFICLTFDIWTETMQTKSFLGVTAHFLTGIKLTSVTIATRQLFERHTSQYISDQLEEILKYWNINKSQIVAAVTDNGANVVGAVTKALGRNKHMPCFAHTINLIAEVITKDPLILPILSKVRDIVKWAKRSVTVSDKLRKLQLDIPEGTVKKLILDVQTRWNSTYYMLERFTDLVTIVNQVIINDVTAPQMLSATELDLARQIKLVLKPLEFVTKEASGELYITVSKIIPMVNCLKNQLRIMTSDIEIITTLKNKLLEEINKRFGLMEHNYSLSISTLLDPRFKRIHFEDPIGCSKSIDHLRKTIAAEQQPSSNLDDSPLQGSSMSPQDKYDFWGYHKTLAHAQNQKSQQSTSKINDELSVYLANPVIALSSDPMTYWEEVKTVFPGLYNQATSHLCIVGTSVPSERLFSKAGGTVTQDRNRLSSKLLEKLLFLADCEEDEWFG